MVAERARTTLRRSRPHSQDGAWGLPEAVDRHGLRREPNAARAQVRSGRSGAVTRCSDHRAVDYRGHPERPGPPPAVVSVCARRGARSLPPGAMASVAGLPAVLGGGAGRLAVVDNNGTDPDIRMIRLRQRI